MRKDSKLIRFNTLKTFETLETREVPSYYGHLSNPGNVYSMENEQDNFNLAYQLLDESTMIENVCETYHHTLDTGVDALEYLDPYTEIRKLLDVVITRRSLLHTMDNTSVMNLTATCQATCTASSKESYPRMGCGNMAKNTDPTPDTVVVTECDEKQLCPVRSISSPSKQLWKHLDKVELQWRYYNKVDDTKFHATTDCSLPFIGTVSDPSDNTEVLRNIGNISNSLIRDKTCTYNKLPLMKMFKEQKTKFALQPYTTYSDLHHYSRGRHNITHQDKSHITSMIDDAEHIAKRVVDAVQQKFASFMINACRFFGGINNVRRIACQINENETILQTLERIGYNLDETIRGYITLRLELQEVSLRRNIDVTKSVTSESSDISELSDISNTLETPVSGAFETTILMCELDVSCDAQPSEILDSLNILLPDIAKAFYKPETSVSTKSSVDNNDSDVSDSDSHSLPDNSHFSDDTSSDFTDDITAGINESLQDILIWDHSHSVLLIPKRETYPMGVLQITTGFLWNSLKVICENMHDKELTIADFMYFDGLGLFNIQSITALAMVQMYPKISFDGTQSCNTDTDSKRNIYVNPFVVSDMNIIRALGSSVKPHTKKGIVEWVNKFDKYDYFDNQYQELLEYENEMWHVVDNMMAKFIDSRDDYSQISWFSKRREVLEWIMKLITHFSSVGSPMKSRNTSKDFFKYNRPKLHCRFKQPIDFTEERGSTSFVSTRQLTSPVKSSTRSDGSVRTRRFKSAIPISNNIRPRMYSDILINLELLNIPFADQELVAQCVQDIGIGYDTKMFSLQCEYRYIFNVVAQQNRNYGYLGYLIRRYQNLQYCNSMIATLMAIKYNTKLLNDMVNIAFNDMLSICETLCKLDHTDINSRLLLKDRITLIPSCQQVSKHPVESHEKNKIKGLFNKMKHTIGKLIDTKDSTSDTNTTSSNGTSIDNDLNIDINTSLGCHSDYNGQPFSTQKYTRKVYRYSEHPSEQYLVLQCLKVVHTVTMDVLTL